MRGSLIAIGDSIQAIIVAVRELSEIIARPIVESLTRASIDWLNNWLTEGQAEIVLKENGRSVAKYGPRMVIVCWGCIAISTAFTLLALIAAPGNAKWFATPFVFMLAASVLALIESKVVRIEFNRDELFVRTVWRGRRLIPWSSVEALGYSWMCHQKIYAGEYGKIVISQYLAGSKALVDLVRAKLAERVGANPANHSAVKPARLRADRRASSPATQ